jgi:hypothetical protein
MCPGGICTQKVFTGDPAYNPTTAQAIPNAEMRRLGVSHPKVTGGQKVGYRALAKSGAPLTWEAVSRIEIAALVRGGMAADIAEATVTIVITPMKAAGIEPR